MQTERAMLRQRLWKFPGPFFSWCYCLCPEFALPLSIWASSGWIGLPLHWQAETNEACPCCGTQGWKRSAAITPEKPLASA